MDKLKQSELYRNYLLPDCKKGIVFPAIRDNRIDFYFKGGKLFSFDGQFKTHIKYASVLTHKNDYVTEADLGEAEPITDFAAGYKRIKENCGHYAGIEAESVSQLLQRFSLLKEDKKEDRIVILDIETSFKSLDEEKKRDRIDLLFYHTDEKRLRFYEAKHFSNSELWKASGSKPPVVGQISRYNKQIEDSKDQIIQAYGNYVEIISDIFGVHYPKPESVDPKTALIIFGFDKDQKEGRLKNLLIEDQSLENINYVLFGNPDKVDISTIWNTKSL